MDLKPNANTDKHSLKVHYHFWNKNNLNTGLLVNFFRGMKLAKVSIYVDDAVWNSFKTQVFQKHGNLRKLSAEVENLLRVAIVEDQVISAFEKIGVKAKGAISSQEIKAARPKLRGPPSEKILKEMRQKRVAQAIS